MKYVKLASITCLVLVSMVMAFLYFAKTQNQSSAPDTAPPIKSKYIAVTPNFGPLLQLEKLTVSYENNMAIALTPIGSQSNIKLGQNVVLYNQQDFAQPLGGKVSAIEDNNNQTEIKIKLPDGTNTDLLASYVEIITLETTASKRLPKTALQKDEDGTHYVWRIFPSIEHLSAYVPSKLPIKIGREDRDFFEEAGFKIKSDDIIIVNPNDDIIEGQPYIITISELNAYLHNPIKQAWIDLELNRLKEDQAEMQKIADECGQGKPAQDNGTQSTAPTSSPSSNDSCGGPFDSGTDPFLIFQSLIQEMSDQNSSAP